MEDKTRLSLQFFAAEGAPAGEGAGEAAPGVKAAAPGQEAKQALEALGVPRQEAGRYGPKMKHAGQTQQTSAPAARDEARKTGTLAELSRDNPALKAELQSIISERVKGFAQARDTLRELRPALELLAKQYDIEPGEKQELDAAALAKAITEDDRFWEEKAAELGVTPALARKIVGYDERHAAQERREQDALQEQSFRQHVGKLARQAEELKQLFPNFDLRRELDDPQFRLFTSPQIGMSVKDAFYALHHDEIRQAESALVARRAREALANSVAAGQSRPREGGGARAASTGELKTRKWTRESIEAVKRDAEAAGARGEKYYIR